MADTPKPMARIMRRPEVLTLLGIATPTLYEMMRDGRFPRPVRVAAKAVGWPENVVHDWLRARMAASEAHYAKPDAA
jgi:prophage regulatory protein